MDTKNYFSWEGETGSEPPVIEFMTGGAQIEDDKERETFVMGYEANGEVIEGMFGGEAEEAELEEERNNREGLVEGMKGGGKKDGSKKGGNKKLRRKLRRARRRARRAENQLANASSASYWDGWWDSNVDDDDYLYPPAYVQPMYFPPPPVQQGPVNPTVTMLPQQQGEMGEMGYGGAFMAIMVIIVVVVIIMLAMRA